ncbi:hypothetical protein [Flavobacterium sp. TSSA_36]|uniref:hypothetical protein n=1 Tax=Flavobacterium sp. TSSA_36 TaxID=3447669 RepID=UPI003F3C5185
MKTEKKLIANDAIGAERLIKQLELIIPTLNEISPLYQDLDLGELDEKTALSMITDRGATASEQFLSVIASNCLAIGANKHFVSQQVALQADFVAEFKAKINEVVSKKPIELSASYFSYSPADRSYFVSEQTKIEIAENFKTYLSDPKQIEMFKAFENFKNALLDLKKSFKDFAGYDYQGDLTELIQTKNYKNEFVTELDPKNLIYFIRERAPKN